MFNLPKPYLITMSALCLALSLAGCAQNSATRKASMRSSGSTQAYSTTKGDTRPHHGVSAAKAFSVEGIDVSKWQGDIDWQTVKSAGVSFAFIKSTEGGDHLDERFLENWNGAKAAGVPRAAYHFVFWCRTAHEQAAWFKQNVPVDKDALPPVLDLEWNAESRTCPARIPFGEARDKIRVMLKAMEEHTGKKPIIYTDITFHEDVLGNSFDEYPYWVRSTAAEPHERYKDRAWSFWQFTTTGLMPGVRGHVDRSVFAGSKAEWDKFLAENSVGK